MGERKNGMSSFFGLFSKKKKRGRKLENHEKARKIEVTKIYYEYTIFQKLCYACCYLTITTLLLIRPVFRKKRRLTNSSLEFILTTIARSVQLGGPAPADLAALVSLIS